MGNTTPNIGIYIMSAGETNYDQPFAQGMINIDQHDHSGGPNKGIPITSSGLSDFSVTYNKLAANVADVTTGIGVDATTPNKLQILGLLQNIYKIPTTAGFISKDGILAHARTFTNSTNIAWTNADGVLGNPSAAITGTIPVANGGTGKSSLTAYAVMLGGTTTTNPVQQVASVGNAGDLLQSAGAGAPPAFVSPAAAGQISTVTRILTDSEFNALNATPILLLAAAGAGKLIMPISMTARLTVSSGAFVGSKTVSLVYAATSIPTLASFSGNFASALDTYYFGSNTGTLIQVANAQNQDVYIIANNASTGGSGNTVTITLNYIVLTL